MREIDATLVGRLVRRQFPHWSGLPITAAEPNGWDNRTFRRQSREAFRLALPLDAGTWARGRAWALWKALITFAGNLQADQAAVTPARRVIDEVFDEHVHTV